MVRLAFFFLMLVALMHQGGQRVVPTRIASVPDNSFSRGNSTTLKATFAKSLVPRLAGGACQHPNFVIRIYDPKLVASDPPRVSADTTHLNAVKPVTPYIQQTEAPYTPLDGPNALTVEKTFDPFILPSKKTARMSRLFLGLFHTCTVAKPKDINETGDAIIYDDALSGGYFAGVFFRLNCNAGRCVYSQE